jgi:hypothetical protein
VALATPRSSFVSVLTSDRVLDPWEKKGRMCRRPCSVFEDFTMGLMEVGIANGLLRVGRMKVMVMKYG